MIKIAHESLLNVKAELIPLLDKHWEETEPNQDTIFLDPDWREYARLDQQGILHIFTARNGGELIGYCVVMISRSVHHKDHIFASTDVIYVKPKYRQTATGSDLICFANTWGLRGLPRTLDPRSLRERKIIRTGPEGAPGVLSLVP